MLDMGEHWWPKADFTLTVDFASRNLTFVTK